MKLSIIVPVYNAQEYLPACVDSLLNQRMEDYEIILIDDGSKDGSFTLMERYKEQHPDKIKIKSIDNGGQGRARNFGIDMAEGDYLGFVDSDDYVSADMFPLMYESALKNGSQIAVCDIEYCYEDRENVQSLCWKEDNKYFAAGSACNKIFLRSLVGSLRFPVGTWYEDFDFSARLLFLADKISYVPRALYKYRLGHESTMNNNNIGRNLEIIGIMDGLKALMNEKSPEEFQSLVINHVLLDSINRVSRQSGEEKKAVIKKLRAYVHENVPELKSCPAFLRESRNRRLIMELNYGGLNSLSKAILNLKSRL